MTRSEVSEHIRNAAEAKQSEVYYAYRDVLLAHDAEQRRGIEQQAQEITRLREALTSLYALVKGECPSVLNEDSGGDAQLAMEIEQALKEHP